MTDKKKKIMILYSTGGLGHKKAALALYEEIRKRDRDLEAQIIDVLDYGNGFYRFAYLHAYVFLMAKAKWIWGLLYYLTNRRMADRVTRVYRQFLDYSCLPGLGRKILKEDPDAIVATHFLLPSIAGVLRKKGLRSRLYALITDYGPHAWWLSEDIDRFFVGGDMARKEMMSWGIPREKIEISGIPTGGAFGQISDRTILARKYGLDPEKKTIFTMSGGFGVGPIKKMLFSLNDCKAEIQVIAVCGHNSQMCEDIRAVSSELNYPLLLMGFTDKVAELMAVADIMLTKAGGISVTEALNSRLPMILYASVPGQEDWNEKFLCGANAAEKARKVGEIPGIADRMLISEDVYESHVEAIEKIRKPRAAVTVIDSVVRDIKE